MVEYRWDGKLSMEDKPKNLGRAYLVGKLRERGLSRRDAVRILNAGFDEMIKALQRGKDVEYPFGSLVRVKRLSGRSCRSTTSR